MLYRIPTLGPFRLLVGRAGRRNRQIEVDFGQGELEVRLADETQTRTASAHNLDPFGAGAL